MPQGFVAPSAVGTADTVDAWLPMVLDNDVLANRQEHIVSVVGRLAPGASLDSARAELSAVSDAVAQAFPENENIRARLDLLHRDQTTPVRTMFATLLGAVALVLLLACVNVAGLLLVRAVARRRETAVRLALGASRGRILLEQLIQSSVLAIAGGAAGLLLGHWLTRLLVSLAPPTIPHIESATLDVRVVMFAVGVTVVTAFLAGLWPAWRAAQAEPVESIGNERGPGGRSVVGRRGGLLVAEVALSTVLLVGALLMVRSLVVLGDVDLGFSPDNVLAATVALPTDRYPTPVDRFRFFDAVSEQIGHLPGVVSVAYGNRLPLRGNWISGMVIDPVIPSAIEPEFREAGFQAVSPGYFSTLGIPSRRGRLLTSQDVGTGEPVAVVNESFVRMLLDGDDPLGRRIRRGPGMPAMTIVGVVGDIRRTGRADEEGRRAAEVIPQVYIPAAQTQLYPLPLRDLAVKVESQAAIGSVSAAIQRLVRDLDPDQPVTTVRTLEDSLALRSAQQRFQAGLFLTFAVVAFGLALVGVYGVVAYASSQRAPEMALRMALGASAAGVVATMVGGFARMIAVGVVAGLGTAWAASDVVANQLFEIRGTDPITYLAAGLLIGTAGLVAALVAARQAGGANVSDVLR
jgi:predicted permease